MAYKQLDNLTIEDATILFRNFAGLEGQYNRAGDRNFSVIIPDPEVADKLLLDGWNVRLLKASPDDQDPAKHCLEVAVNFNNIPPKVMMITSTAQTPLTDASVGCLDYADITHVDLIIRPYNWKIQEGTKNEKSGIKAYLKAGYFTIEEDQFAAKYADREYKE